MRPKTFPATTYSGNSRQRLQEIREGLKQPSKSSAPGLPVGPSHSTSLDAKVLGGKDAARQQQMRTTPKFGPYQKALREIRYSLLPFANESGTSTAAEVNRQMLQELVNAGCDQEMAGRALKQTGSRSIEAALEYISKMGYLDPRNEQIVRVIKQTSPGKGAAPAPAPRRPSFEAAAGPFPPYRQAGAAAFEGAGAGALQEGPRQYADFLLAGAGAPGGAQPPPQGYPAGMEASGMSFPVASPGGPHYRPHLLAPGEPVGYGVQRSPSFQNKEAGGYSNLAAKGPAGQPGAGHAFAPSGAAAGLYVPHPHHKQAPQLHMVGARGQVFASDSPPPSLIAPSRNSLTVDLYDMSNPALPQWQSSLSRRDSVQKPGLEAPPRQHVAFLPEGPVPSRANSFNSHQQPVVAPVRTGLSGKTEPAMPSPNTITAVTAAHILHPVKSVRVMRPEPQTAVGPSHPAWVPAPSPGLEGLDSQEEHPLPLGGTGACPLEVEYGSPDVRCPPPPYPKHLLLQSKSQQFDVDGLCVDVEQGLRGAQAAEAPERSDKSHKNAKGDKAGKDKKQIQTSPVPVRKNSRDEEKRESRIKSYSPYAFKFFMEQHVENVIKTYQQKVNRRLQLEQEMAKAGLCEAEQEQMRKILYQKESNYNRLKRAKMDKSMFVKIKTLGIGAFGEVCLACKVDTHALYAMKTLRKKDVLNRNQVAHVKAERDILAEADNEWVVKLYYSFQDKDSLYFVMDYIPGGDMMSLLIRMEVFPEPLARFYIAELTLAIESVHKMGFIHRDIKPDNILIDLDGHIKLTDFGLCTGFRWTHNSKYYQKGSHIRQDSMEPSDLWDDVSNCQCGDRLKTLEQRARKQHQRCLAHSLVGTPNYIAPEVLLRKGYTQLCDWWSVGVILFEMLVGQPPFLAPTPTETQLKVINWENTLHIPAQVQLSPEARDLITALCCAADRRLGRNGADDLKAHPFFGALDFSRDIRKQPAPYVPKISHPMDTSNFDPVDEESPWRGASADSSKAWDPLASPGSKHPEHAFYEFTFRRFFDDNGYPFRCPKPSGAEAAQAEDADAENPDPAGPAAGCQPVYV
ncbi:serine/threonine-protein kinase LATS2 [Manis pentadactyla]|uniref:serine/threonine-protein kinase LATS2 n=1 Tax=Manis pentadactyla TaxID=143292 RepID=UPI00255CFCF2|nr:serine/threonine-protein kinase LATS2 [Manis pentadactyla]KAI5245310.1 Serine/Threonine-Protein Kinase Lats2 [Manis pentadactyla]